MASDRAAAGSLSRVAEGAHVRKDRRVTKCADCGAELSDWEGQHGRRLGGPPCWCAGLPSTASLTVANFAYTVLCDPSLTLPVKVHDVVRLVGAQFGKIAQSSLNVVLSHDK